MSGIRITIPTAFTNVSLPILAADPILPAAGALLLYDANHPAGSVSGALANGLSVPNIALDQALAMYPAGSAAGLNGQVEIGPDFIGALGFVERSAKGGLHFAVGSTTTLAVTRYARVGGGSQLAAYLNANKTHSFYHSTWARITAMPTPLTNSANVVSKVGASFQLPYFYVRPTGNTAGPVVYPVDARLAGSSADGAVGLAVSSTPVTNKTDIGPVMWAGAVNNYTAVADIVTAAGNIAWNNAGPAVAPEIDTRGVSSIFYRAYVEDLTVSGRTFAQVQAIDYAQYVKHVLTAGGRYYGDTFTPSPA